ncbi:synembryn-A isoform X1 [Narcine bancroftii]|uniref:synembryn-A isoform X1 n=1 Tax=Narcine bancroftii TaxID=1343680 RepID=UPI0038317CBB
MDLKALIDILQSGDQDMIQNALSDFNREFAQCFFFNAEAQEKRKIERLEKFRITKHQEQYASSDYDSDSNQDREVKLRERIGELVIEILERDLQPSCRLAGLVAVRILSRDKQALLPFARPGPMRVLAWLAGIGGGRPSDAEAACEALKCLCNTVYNSPAAREAADELGVLDGLAYSLKARAEPEARFYELRLVFLLTALSTGARQRLGHELRGLVLLTDALEAELGLRWREKEEEERNEAGAQPGSRTLKSQETDRAMEILKVLFNITSNINRRQVDEEDAALYRHLAAILRHCLLTHTECKERTQEFHGHTVNLLVNLPLVCLDVLLTPKVEPGSVEYTGLNMDAVAILLDFMDKRLDQGLKLRETLTPVLSLLTESSRFHRETRKFLRARVLPPLRDVRNRPEVGDSLRNKLVRLMTHINTDVKHCAAEFLFVLCKENVSRFVKYTGYGNAAGLLAARGLLGGGRGEGEYSEEEHTDTEEYKEAKPNINPVTGRVEEKLPDPMEGMTEEQKEYEAMKLVSMFDKLSREQIIQPMVVGCDGKLTPLDETVQQMAEQISLHSDSDLD